MSFSSQSGHDRFRILLYRRNGNQLLLERNAQGLALPNVCIPPYTRVVQQINEAIWKDWRLQSFCLFPVGDANSHAYAVELWAAVSWHPASMNWLPIDSLAEIDFCEAQDFHAIETATKLFDQYENAGAAEPFGKFGWLRHVSEWVESKATQIGLHLTGNFQQLNASPAFSLVRFETNASAIWFKAVGEPNLHEYSITRKLATDFPEFLPRLLGSRPEWNAWLSVEAEGTQLGRDSSPQDWQRAGSRFARLQIATFGHALHLIDAGCRDVRTHALTSLLGPFFDLAEELMDQQTRATPAALSRHELQMLACEIEASLACLADSDIPNVLVHMDLNPENILVGASSCVFLDWAEGAVGHPVFSFEYLREHWRKLHGADLAAEKALFSVYAREWQAFVSPAAIATALEHTPLVAAFASASVHRPWQQRESSRVTSAPYLRSLARRMKREADALQERRAACLL